jgi:hypothetical protein
MVVSTRRRQRESQSGATHAHRTDPRLASVGLAAAEVGHQIGEGVQPGGHR